MLLGDLRSKKHIGKHMRFGDWKIHLQETAEQGGDGGGGGGGGEAAYDFRNSVFGVWFGIPKK